MLAQLLLAASVAFHAPLSSHVAMKRAPAPQAIGGFFGGGGDLQLFPDDVQFKDVDGDTVTLRGVRGKVDFYVNGKLTLSSARMQRTGNTLEITGTIKKGTPLSFLGFNLEDTVTEGTTPSDPADADKAMGLVQ